MVILAKRPKSQEWRISFFRWGSLSFCVESGLPDRLVWQILACLVFSIRLSDSFDFIRGLGSCIFAFGFCSCFICRL